MINYYVYVCTIVEWIIVNIGIFLGYVKIPGMLPN